MLRTVAHAPGPAVGEKVVPSWHVPHFRSVVAVPSAVLPLPAAHSAHAAQESRPLEDVNVRDPQAAHTKSLVVVASAVVCVPGAHGPRTGVHDEAPADAENPVPAWHAAHVRSRVAVAASAV